MKELSHQSSKMLYQFTTDGVMLLDRQGAIGQTNEQLKSIFGILGNELYSLPVDSLLGNGFFHRISNELAYVNQAAMILERKIMISPGKYLYMRCTSVPLPAEEEYGFLILVQDITELKEFQNTIQLNRELHIKHYEEKKLGMVMGMSEIKALINEEIRISKEMKTPLSIIVFDKSFFEYIHYAYGFFWEQKGMDIFRDEVRGLINSPIEIGRIEQNSFVILLPWVKQEAAEELANKIRKRVEQLRQAIEVEEMNLVRGFGVAELDLNRQESFDSLILRADQFRVSDTKEYRPFSAQQ